MLGIAAFLFCLLPVVAHAQFSPGPLSKAHSKLDGPTHCTSCHVAVGGGRKFKCTSCHVEIRQRLAANQGLHPALMGSTRHEEQCVKCHSDHNGEHFVPIRWDVSLDEFDHRKTGYPLEGNHAGLKCDRCHTPARVTPAARKGILMKDLRRTYLGLGTACIACHQDQHQRQLGDKCDRCHTVASGAKWKDVTRFDHSTAKFKLTGSHVKAACGKCHVTLPSSDAAKPVVRYAGMPFAACTDCHKDPHRGSFAAGCKACHNDVAWKPARNTVSNFDHSRTKFPLLGKHAPVTCDKCHKTSDFKTPVAHEQCQACHQDIHQGQFASRAGGDCAGCHTTDGWKPSTFTGVSHSQSAYPLLGKHAAVTCDKCHQPAGAATLYKVRYQACLDCHRDPHDSQFAKAPHKNRCEDCHAVEGFEPAKFTLTRHRETQFPLTGAHAAVACGECHQKTAEFHNTVAYQFTNLTCAGCHADPHQPQSRDRTLAAKMRSGTECEVCHNVRTWRETAVFDHAKTRFPLVGSHRGAACEQCHRATALSLGVKKVVFTNAPLVCVGCHEDIHAGQFAAASENRGCEACHGNSQWKPGTFDHARTSFPLDGAHQKVPCQDCHSTRREVNGRMVVFYRPTPRDCVSCHGPNIKK